MPDPWIDIVGVKASDGLNGQRLFFPHTPTIWLGIQSRQLTLVSYVNVIVRQDSNPVT